MRQAALQPTITWAEDRATQRCDPAPTQRRDRRGSDRHGQSLPPPLPTLRDRLHALNLRGTMPQSLRQDAAPNSLTANSQNSSSR